ncbi:MAG: DUF1566 domain-containing protein [Parabacteroides gordonii]|uniref:Lcl domain-containing protein n=1 Tax=Parabacteroides gordonii TaxID=574930 RepID=UPI003A84404B
MNKSIHLRQFFRMGSLVGVLALFTIMQACTDEMEQATVDSGKGETATLELSLSVPPMLETKAMICEADSGSEACKAGFYYEMQVLTTDTVHTDSLAVATKAASSLKNVYAFLFKSDGAFNGRASLSTANISTDLSLEFSNIADASAANGRLVIVANDNSATVNYASSTAFANFSGTYAAFQNLTLTSAVTTDANIPYVGSATVSLSGGAFTAIPAVQLYRMLAKIVLTNNTFSITGGPARNAINLYNAGNKYFGTPNNYDGTGSTVTASGRYLTTATAGNNASSNTWYVGENVQTATATAAYIELGTGVGGTNTSPSIGQEYIASGGYAFKYKVYLTNTALRRNNVYNVTVNVSGTLAKHLELAGTTNSNVSVTNTVVHGGLNIGKFGGASGYTTGTGTAPTITGSYTKNLLIQPNTSGTTATDNVTRKWSDNTTTQLQTETRKYWDRTYTLAHIDKTAGLAYDYCYNLTIGGVAKGTWYLPTQAQLMAMWGILRGIQVNSSYADYSAFNANSYWSSSEYSASSAWYVGFYYGSVYGNYKANTYRVRCVRDL